MNEGKKEIYAVAGDDPVFAAIAEHRRCKEIADAALAVYKGIGDDICAARDAIAIVRFDGHKYYNLSSLDRAVRLRGRLSGK